MPDWYTKALANRHMPSTSIEFAKDFFRASLSERKEVLKSWDTTLTWSWPKPYRLACHNEGPGSMSERILTSLLFNALGFDGSKESIYDLGVIYNSCKLADLLPEPIFEKVAKVVGGLAENALLDFIRREPDNASMKAFGLTAIPNSGGGFEIRSDMNDPDLIEFAKKLDQGIIDLF